MQENKIRQLHGTKELTAPHIEVHMERHVWDKMYGWCKAARSEVSGMGLVKIVDGKFIVYDAFLPKQYCSSGYTEIDDISNSKLQERLIRKGQEMTHFRFWWHTHYNFNVFWSGTDDDNAKEQMKYNGEWELSVVINQAGEYRARADFMTTVHPLLNFPQHYLVDELKMTLIPNSRYHRRKRNFKADVRRWVKPMSELPESQKPKPIVYTPYSGPTMLPSKPMYQYEDMGGMDYGDRDDGNWLEKWKKERAENGKRDIGFHVHRSVRDTKYDKKDVESPVTLKNGDKYGPYVWWEGVLVSPAAYENIKKGLKIGHGKEEGSCSVEAWHEQDDSAVPGECPCGSTTCWEGSHCIPCIHCGGRWNTSSGNCPGCVQVVKESTPGACDCPHSGKWEECKCNQTCYKCIEDEYAMIN